jgi:hypothetical protein
VGTNYKPHASAAEAMDDACLSVRKHFDPSFSCARNRVSVAASRRNGPNA